MEHPDFDRVLALLLEWQGRTVIVGVDATQQPLAVATMLGTLNAAADIANPYDHEEFEFTLGERTGFALRRDYFTGAHYFPDSRRLIVSMSHAPAGEDATPSVDVHIVVQKPYEGT